MRVFFKDQVLDNILWSMVAVVFMTFWECLMWYAYANANGLAPMITFSEAPIWFVVLIVLMPIEAGLHFYGLHRVLHIGKIYTWVHACIIKTSKRHRGQVFLCIRRKLFLES